MKFKYVNDRALVSGPTLRVEVGRRELYIWWHQGPHVMYLRSLA